MSRTLLHKLKSLKNKEINHLIIMISMADKYGIVRAGYDHHEVFLRAHISQRHHYNCISSLLSKGIYELDDQGNVLILFNSIKECIEKGGSGYINLPSVVFDRTFLLMSVSAKRYLLHLLTTYAAKAYFKTSISSIMSQLGLNRPQKARDVLRELLFTSFIELDSADKSIYKKTVLRLKLNPDCIIRSVTDDFSSRTIVKSILHAKGFKRNDCTPVVLSDFVHLFNIYKEKFYLGLDYLSQATAKGNIYNNILLQLTHKSVSINA